jgi:hypothetical protein
MSDLQLDIESWLRTKRYDKCDNFNIPIVKFPFICSNIPGRFAYEVYICQLIWYSRAADNKATEPSVGYWLRWSHLFVSFKMATMAC